MRLIFLDIDGVIATDRTYAAWRRANAPKTFEGYLSLIDTYLLSMIDDLAKDIGAQIVLSTTWRDASQQGGITAEDILRAAGLTTPIMGHTPHLPLPADLFGETRRRGYEINAYLVKHNIPIEDIIVFDDDTGAVASPKGSPIRHGGRVIFTPEREGINPNHINRARKMFGLQPKEQPPRPPKG